MCFCGVWDFLGVAILMIFLLGGFELVEVVRRLKENVDDFLSTYVFISNDSS